MKSETGVGSAAVPTADIPHPRVARQTVRSVQKYLSTYEPPIGNVADDRQPIVHVLWGWWIYLVEQSMVVVREAERGRFITTTPLVRSIGEHADLMLWLADAGPDGITALHAAAQETQRNLWDSYQRSEGHPPEGGGLRPAAPAPMRTTREVHARNGLRSVEQRMGMVEGGVPYYIYRLHSGLTHAGLNTSHVYAPVAEGGIGHFLNRPDEPLSDAIGDAPVLDVAARCVHASLIFQREVNDQDLAGRVTRWRTDMGISGELPTITPPKPSPLTALDVEVTARRVLQTELRPAQDALESLVANGLPNDLDPEMVVKALRRVGRSAQHLTALCREAT